MRQLTLNDGRRLSDDGCNDALRQAMDPSQCSMRYHRCGYVQYVQYGV